MRPRNIVELVLWASLEGAGSRPEPPSRLHAKHVPAGEDPGHTGRDVIVGLPFTKQFGRYLDGERPRTPIRRALAKMRAHGPRQSVEYRICHAVVEGGQPVEHVQTVLRCSDQVVYRSLATLYELTELEIAQERPLSKPGTSIA